MNKADLERVFDVLQYIGDNYLPNTEKGVKLSEVYHHFKLNRKELADFTKYLQDR